MNTRTLNIDSLVEETYSNLYRHTGRPLETSVGATALDTASATELTLEHPSQVQVSDTIEFADGELCRVTAKSADSDPVFTVIRGFAGTTASTHATGDTVVKPTWARSDVKRWVERFFDRAAQLLPNITVLELQRQSGLRHVLLPTGTIDVRQVQGYSSLTGNVVPLGGWRMARVPTSASPSGLMLVVPTSITDADVLWVTTQSVYTITNDEVDYPIAGADLPGLWAAAFGVARREVDRGELDRMAEWSQEQAIRAGVNLRLVRELWGEFYRAVDEARDLETVTIPKHRPFVPSPKVY